MTISKVVCLFCLYYANNGEILSNLLPLTDFCHECLIIFIYVIAIKIHFCVVHKLGNVSFQLNIV